MSETGKPGRYQRSASGLIGAMIIIVVGVLLVIGYRSLFRSDVEIRPENIDYLEVVALAEDAGVTPTYPSDLPKGWIATTVDVDPAAKSFALSLLTDDEEYVGIRQADRSVTALLSEYVDEKAVEETEPITVSGSVAEEWQGYRDGDGDTAYAAEVNGQQVLVFGSATPDQLQDVLERLTTDRPAQAPR